MRSDLVQQRLVRRSCPEGRRIIAVAADPLAGRLGFGASPHDRQQRLGSGSVRYHAGIAGMACTHRMNVQVMQPWQHGLAVKIESDRGGRAMPRDLRRSPERDDRAL